MPIYTADALILRTYKLGESDRIVVFLTRDRGKKRGVAKNARQSRRRVGGGLQAVTRAGKGGGGGAGGGRGGGRFGGGGGADDRRAGGLCGARAARAGPPRVRRA